MAEDQTDLLLEDLRQEIKKKHAVIIVGAGVSLNATGGNPVASWTGLLQDGVKRCAALFQSKLPDGWARRVGEEIKSGDMGELLSAAEKISRTLAAPKGGEYKRWLRETVGSLRVKDPRAIAALKNLGVPLATTNYDGLIEEVTGWPPVTWRQDDKVEAVLRGDEDGVVHLHGYWGEPESVILGIRSYEDVLKDQHAQAIQRGLRALRTFLFVGFGAGLADPNFGALLRWARAVFPESTYRHYRLARRPDYKAVEAEHTTEDRIFVLSYGENYEDLAPFLQGLAPGVPPELPAIKPCIADHELSNKEAPISLTMPPPPEPFIGHDDLLQKIREQIRKGGVTILKGAGGIGKTALALTAADAARRDGELPGDVVWLNCELYSTSEKCLRAMARRFFSHIKETKSIARVEELLLKHLGECGALVVLDSFEMIAEDAELRRWLGRVRAPARLLVTTRKAPAGRLGVVIPINELPLQKAVELFEQRAIWAGWDGYGREMVPDLCAAIGCLPLAIELLAARAAGTPLPELQRLLQQGLDVLTTDDVTLSERHRSIRACYTLSYDRLSPGAQTLLLSLSVLPDGAGSEVITEVAGSPDVGLTVEGSWSRHIGTILGGNWHMAAEELVGTSIWRLEKGRYIMHSLVRQFALKQLGARQIDAELHVARRIIQWARAMGRQAEPGRADKQRLKALNWMEAEWGNLLACAKIGAGAQDWEIVTTLSDAVRDFSYIRGFRQDCEDLHKQALSARRDAGDLPGVMRTLDNLGLIYETQGRWSNKRQAHEEALQIARKIGDPIYEAKSLQGLGVAYHGEGQLDEAEAALKMSLDIFRSRGNRMMVGITIDTLGAVYCQEGRLSEAEECYKKSLELKKEFDDSVGIGHTLSRLGLIYCKRERWAEAEKYYRQSLDVSRNLVDQCMEAILLKSLAELQAVQGNFPGAVDLGRQAMAILQKIPERPTLEEIQRSVAEWEQKSAEGSKNAGAS